MTTKEILQQFGEKIVEGIRKKQAEKGLTASGKSASGLVSVSDETRLQVIDTTGSFEYQEFGRGATRPDAKTGSPTLRELIYDWLQFQKYNLHYKDDKERVSLSYAISSNIHKMGTYTKRSGTQTGVLSEVINSDLRDELMQTFKDHELVRIRTEIKRLFK